MNLDAVQLLTNANEIILPLAQFIGIMAALFVARVILRKFWGLFDRSTSDNENSK